MKYLQIFFLVIICVAACLAAVAEPEDASALEDKKNNKRGIFGFGYGHGYGHGYYGGYGGYGGGYGGGIGHYGGYPHYGGGYGFHGGPIYGGHGYFPYHGGYYGGYH
ncbi:neuropeptide-like protein 31 [Bactrocera neohumeralis]|uniref:neuropeptide-like protein 31 n=1 Tax=Bactrocera neohumeralis TaxID=98809 RepID=UPI002165AEBB|nr:neuropeptide-like protein 31 [Bactrocera neohumeralis]